VTAPALAAALLLACGAHAAQRPIKTPASDFPASAAWLNAKPITLKLMRGRRVAVVAFVHTVNLNSLRAINVLKTWDEKYALSGLSVIAVHTPIFGFQRDPAAVKTALKRLGVTFPVVLDNDKTQWNAYAVEGWPAFFLLDHKGRIVFDLLGEGGYEAFEEEIRVALEDAGYRVQGPLAAADPPRQGCGLATPELGFGTAAAKPVKAVDLDEVERRDEMGSGELIIASRDGETSRNGAWKAEPELLRLAAPNNDRESFIRAIYRGSQLLGLLSGPSGAKPAKFFVRQDGLWLHEGNAGADVKFDGDGRSFASATTPRLYSLVRNRDDSMHEVSLMPMEAGASIYGLQFADRCLPYQP
jgi:hypothetical protein